MTTIDRTKVWTGTLNEVALAGRPKAKVGFYDTTLRDGEQSTGVMFDPQQKLEIACLVDGLGAGRIEAGFPRVSEDDREAIKRTLWVATTNGYGNALDAYLRVKTEAQVRAKEEDTSPDIAYLAASLGQDPNQIPALLDLEKDYRASINSLEAAARAGKTPKKMPMAAETPKARTIA